jgi:hypothetical protein
MTWTALYRPLHVHAQATHSQINASQFPVLDMLGGVSLSDLYGHTGTVYLFIQECTICWVCFEVDRLVHSAGFPHRSFTMMIRVLSWDAGFLEAPIQDSFQCKVAGIGSIHKGSP